MRKLRLGLTAKRSRRGRRPRRVAVSSAPGLHLAGEAHLGASVALPLVATGEQAGAPTTSRIVTIAARPRLAVEEGQAPPGVDLTLDAAPIAASSGTPDVVATVALVAWPGVATGDAPEMTADAAIAEIPSAAATGHLEAAASALLTSTPGMALSGASPFTSGDATISGDRTLWIDGELSSGIDLTLAAAPIATSSGTPEVAATMAVVAEPGVAAGGAPEMSADAAIAKAPLAAATSSPGVAATAVIASTPQVTIDEASPITFTDGTIWDDDTPWIDD